MTNLERTKAYTRLFDQQMALYEGYARRNGLQGKSLQLLLWLYYNPNGMTQKLLGQRTHSTKQVVNATIKSWLDKDWVTLKENTVDKRQKLVILTTEGRQHAAGILDPLENAEKAAFSTLTSEEQVFFLQLSQRYAEALNSELEKL